jgi:hypothetical protein
MKKFKNIKLMLIGLCAMMSVNAFAQEKATTVWRYTVDSDNKATLIGFVADLDEAKKKDVEIPNEVSDPKSSTKYKVKYIEPTALDKGKLETLTIKAGELEQIPAALVQDAAKLTKIDLSGATNLGKGGVDGIPANAFKGTKISDVDLSKTQVQVIHNWFGTTYKYNYTVPGGKWSNEEADKENEKIIGSASMVHADEPKTGTGDPFMGYNEINKYYKEIYPEYAKKNGDPKPYDKAAANKYNKTTFSAAPEIPKEAGDPVLWTLEEKYAENLKTDGALEGGTILSAIEAIAFNSTMGLSETSPGYKKAGDEITEADANAYNALLDGAAFSTTQLTADVQKKDDKGNLLKYDDDTAYEYNYEHFYGVAGYEGLALEGNDSGDKFTSHKEAYDWNIANLPNLVSEPTFVAYDLYDENPSTMDKPYTADEAAKANYEAAKAIDPENAVEPGSAHEAVTKTQPKATNTTLKSVTLSKTWTVVDSKAFEACEGLTSIDFNTAAKAADEQPQSIYGQAFLGTAVTEFDFVGTNVNWVPSSFFVTQGDENAPNSNATLTTVKFNKLWTSVSANTFKDCTALATVTFEDRDAKKGWVAEPGKPKEFEVPFYGIGTFAFANTAIEAIVIPESLDASDSGSKDAIAENAFSGCNQLKNFTYMVDNATAIVAYVVNDLAFAGCKDVIYNTTNANVAKYMSADKKAPKNSTFNIVSGDGYVTPFTAIEYKKVPGKYYIKYKAATNIMVAKNEAKVYNAYIDEGGDLTLNMCLYRASEGYYKIKAGDVVLIITNNKDLTFETKSGITSGSMLGLMPNALKIVEAKEGYTRAYLDWEAGADKSIYGWVNSATAGTGWQKITTGNIFPQGTLYILAAEPAEGARLNVRWLDENGNVEEETTGIESVINVEDAQIGEIYNLQGVRVNKAKKGLYIQNGKKYVVK